MVIAKPGLDGHDRGAKIIARALRDAGMEVIYTGLHQTPEQIVETAIQEDADAVGISILSGAHMTLVPRILDGLKENGVDDVLVLVGGTIPNEDAEELKGKGVAAVFTPGAPTSEIVDFLTREDPGLALRCSSGRSTRRATSRRCARAARCPRSSRRATTASTCSSSAAPARGRRRSSPRSSPASSRGRSASASQSSRSFGSTPRWRCAEPDAEIQDLLRASGGLNLGVDFLPGALPFNPAAEPAPSPEQAAAIVWLDALVTNVDRTAKNTNMLLWHDRLWLIDHGAALYFHHGEPVPGHELRPFEAIAEHVLLPFAGSIVDADAELAPRVTEELLRDVAAAVPEEWLGDESRGPVRRVPAAAGRGAAGVRRGGGASSCRLARSRMRSTGSCRASSAASGSTSASSSSRGRSTIWPRAPGWTNGVRGALAGAGPATVRAQLDAIERVAAGEATAGPIAQLDTTARFHWLVAPSSTIIQPSAVHTGLCADPAAELEKLYESLVTA